MLHPPDYPLQGFGGKPIKPVGKVSLPVSFGDLDNARTESLAFDVVDIYHPYLAIFGRGFMNKFDAVIRQQFLCMKIPASKGVITVFGDQQEARNIEKGHTPGQVNVHQLKTTEERKEPYEEAKRDIEKIEIAGDGETRKVYLDDMPDRAVTIGAHLNPEEEKELIQFLNKNKDVFAWSAKDLQGVDRDIIEHTLKTYEKIVPKKQKLRKMSEEKAKVVEAAVQRLQDAKVIREVKYPVWLANTVPVKKNGKWRMCVDFTDLNKACKKDDFPLERVDKIVDDATNSEMLSLLDMFSGYHQIRACKENEEKTSFITPFGTFCFVRMPEGLKNAGCTFSRMIAIVLHPQLRRNILAYVDDIVVKSVQRRDHISDLAETFVNLRAANLRLNPEKCVLGIHKGKVLGCLVSTEGIEASPNKIKALIEMQDSVSLKDVQKLTGGVTALNMFIPRAAERSLPFFQVLRSTKNFQWSETQKQAFQELKDYLSNMTKLCPPKPRSPLLLYVSASSSVVSAVLVQEKEEEGKLKQIPVYFASEALSGSKIFYYELEKIAYAVIMAARKLRHYFKGHRIRVITNQPLNDLFTNREASTRIIKWGTKLSEYIVDFKKRSAIKSQVLADFVVDWTSPTQNLNEEIPTPWIVQCDGSWCHKGVGISAVVTSPAGVVIRYAARLIFTNNEHSTNNTTKYEALLLALRKMKALGQQPFIIKTDSKVIQEHIEKESEVRNPVLMKYLEKVREMKRHFKGYSVQHIPRDDNNEADKLAKAAARNQEMPLDVFFEIIKEPSIKEASVTTHPGKYRTPA
jgi:ribonuclease HI